MRILIFISLLAFGLSSCGGGNDCTTETIVGTYVGTNDCEDVPDPSLVLNEGDITMAVEHISGDSYKVTDSNGQEYALIVNGCDFIIPEVEIIIFGALIKTSGDGNFDGDQVTINILTTLDGLSFTCTLTGTKS